MAAPLSTPEESGAIEDGAIKDGAIRRDRVALLQALVRIPSPNPPGDCREIAEFCERTLHAAGFETQSPSSNRWPRNAEMHRMTTT